MYKSKFNILFLTGIVNLARKRAKSIGDVLGVDMGREGGRDI